MLREVATDLRAEARRTDERRVLVLAGDRTGGHRAAERAIEAAGIPRESVTAVGTGDGTQFDTVRQSATDSLLGTTRGAIVLDCHETCRPNALGRVVGTVDGGGLLVLVVPPLEEWPNRRDEFDEYLAVPPAAVDDVGGRFRERLVRTLRTHRGIAIVDVDENRLLADGLTHSAPRPATRSLEVPPSPTFPRDAFVACRTQDQIAALSTLENLRQESTAVVVEADRGRGKSSAAGLAAGSFAAAGEDVLVTAPNYRSAAAVFERASRLGSTLEVLAGDPAEPRPRVLETTTGGRVRFERPARATTLPEDPDVVLVDEAAALPVRRLESFLDASRVGFTTTVHGYEGAGRGFDVRFRDRLAESDHAVHEVRMAEPIRYAPGDPVEVWAFNALLLDARPAVDPLVEDAQPPTATYRVLTTDALLADEWLLREAFGLLVSAHYRTEPNDLARLLDAPNLSVRALLVDGHVVSVALLAREGGLDAETRAAVYEGGRIRGNMIPDVLMSQLRDESAGEPVGMRVMRIATHAAVRDRGFGSRLLEEIRAEFDDRDWIGTGFGATPRLVRFWAQNGFSTVHLSTTRNATSGEYSVIMFDPLSAAGDRLHDRHTEWFVERIGPQLTDVLRDVDADVVRFVLRASAADAGTRIQSLSAHQWRLVVGAAYGPALYSVDPGPFERLALHYLVAGSSELLSEREERLLVTKVLQGHSWETVVDRLGYHGTSAAMRALGDAYRPIVEAYAPEALLDDRDRYGP
ncbi:tRNA(Met) C34 N-acetyltransferase TmcA [Halanaeroarchaeum sp. HSR-CO]|uniref:tRNA(Met) cytidine acetyltransferase TmcA n=1 Tax=Halanaeroarchaeum sp. HSR-CO TaxID=2866382 RepID=UPI00217EB948|nr:tRNA(Met) cytidine acetyltransferase TmcA [Halanaeroarchaeum sp. HSR-CO]UWG48275.1 tRNA(Met) C34 N-acetyltransferase TmcA [Halanaeroarchaeum sp. HSR-CO]